MKKFFYPLMGLISLVLPVHADSIGLNFGSGRANASLSAGSSAGVVPQTNWNNASGSGGSIGSLANQSGSASGASVTWATDEEWSVGGAPADSNGILLNGFVSENNSGANSTIQFSGIPYATYDLYVYMSHDRVSEDVDFSGPWGTFRLHEDDTNISSPVTFNQQTASANPDTSQMGNYAVFTGLSGASLNLTMAPTGAAGSLERNAIAGIQIVEAVVIPGLPEVDNAAVSSLTSNSATANGDLISNGDGADLATMTIYWGLSDGGDTPGSWGNSAAAGTRTSPGAFSANLTGVMPNTNYFYRSYVSNSAGDDWAGDSVSFSTPAALPAVQTVAASAVTGTSAIVGGNVTSTGGDTPELVVHYGDNDAGTGVWDSQLNLGDQSGSSAGGISGLTPGTTYYFRAAATNSAGQTWAGNTLSFTTTAVGLPAIVNQPATDVNGTFATLNGEVNSTGGDVPTVVIYYGTTDQGTVAGNWDFSAALGSESGSFSQLVSNLQPTTTYYFRSMAENAAGQSWSSSSLSFTTPVFVAPAVVINEVHYDEDNKTVRAEFIELHNPSDQPVNLGGYYFSEGIDYTFPGGTILPDGGYLVVAEDPATMLSHFGYNGALGPFENGTVLKNSGENIVLVDPAGTVIDEVDYQLGFPWPTVGDDIGSPLASPSIELINPLLENDLGGNWRASGFPVASSGGGGGGPVTLLSPNQSGWRYRKGITYPSVDGTGKDWWDNGYDDSVDGQWLDGTTVIGYGDGDDDTLLTDMQGNYLSIFLRKEFTIAPGGIPSALTVNCYHDDGAVVYINGVEVTRFSMSNGAIPFPPNGMASSHERGWTTEVVSGVAGYLVEGNNVVAVQAMSDSIGSSDLSIDLELITADASAGSDYSPTPGASNSSFATNAPPQVRQVDHLPLQPTSGQDVVVTAKITDPNGVASASLQYQIVEPGDYFCRYLKFSTNGNANPDSRYEDPAEWTSVPMVDDGTGGDALAADSIYTVTLPASLQTNRRLIRYRIIAEDTPGSEIRVPYEDDPQPNFAYFVYDGTPDWSGVIRPGDAAVNYPGSLMSSIPTYFLLSTNAWVDDSQFGGYGGSEYLWPGTMIYEGRVYDHIQYRPRGGVHRYQYGKNFWKFDFKRGHRFKARDEYGDRYETDWDKLNFSSIVQQVNFGHRGEQGLFENVGFRLFELSGVPSCETHYNQFYVIDEASPTGANQYEGDYYGLFLTIEQMDGQYLDQHGLPDANLYKIEGHAGQSNNQGPYQVSNGSDVSAFISGYRNQSPSAQWWEDNLDIDSYLSYRTVVEGIHHYDIAYGKNYFYFHNSDIGKFQVLPWDLDLTWANNMYGNGNHDFKAKVAQNPAFNTDYQNRVREIMDLLYNTDEGYRLIDESVRPVWTAGSPSLVSADRRLWDNNPRINAADRYYDVANDNDFSGMIQVLKNYIVSRGSWMESNLLTNEGSIPATPTITYAGGGFATNDMQFTSSAYSGGTAFGAMEWRVSEIYNSDLAAYVDGEPFIHEIENPVESGEISPFNASYQFPVSATRVGNTYRARVRHRDASGRWSHWSAPVEFIAAEPDVTLYADSLRISEIHFDPANPTPAEQANGWDDADFEFIEITNVGPSPIDLTGVRFTKGIDYDFLDGTMIASGAYLVVVKNQAAFESRYGTGLSVAGVWEEGDRLSDSENVKLSLGNGTAIIEFVYDSVPPWPTEPDGGGPSLTLNDPAGILPADHALAASWRASFLTGGSPGTNDGSDYSDWLVENGLAPGTLPEGDTDGDGMNELLEYALVSDPNVRSVEDLPMAQSQSIEVGGNTDEYFTLSFKRQLGASDLSYNVQVSDDLSSWSSGEAVLHSSTDHGDGSATEVWRLPLPVSNDSKKFLRLRVEML